MNSTFTDSAAGRRATSHARLSGFGPTASNLRSLFGISQVHAYASSLAGPFGGASTEDRFAQLWSPGLLDRLQEPLTRYRE